MTSTPYDAQDTTPRTGTVGEFAAFALDCVAEGLGGAKLVLLTEDHVESEGDFLSLDQHANEDGTFTRDTPVEWSESAFTAFTEHLTEDQGFALYKALKDRFDWSGTVFCRGDVMNSITEDDRAEGKTPEQLAAVIDAVMDGYLYRKLDDRFAERGYEMIADAVGDAFRDAGFDTPQD